MFYKKQIKVRLERESIVSLKNYLDALPNPENSVPRYTDHWRDWLESDQGNLYIENDNVVVEEEAGKGFDANFINNFPKGLVRKTRIAIWPLEIRKKIYEARQNKKLQKLVRRNLLVDNNNYSDSFPATRQKILARYHFKKIMRFVENEKKSIKYLEIGPGAGILAGLFLKNSRVDNLTLIDLPENIPYAWLQLKANFPDLDISLPTDSIMPNRPKVQFYTPDDILQIKPGFNVIVNTESFAEMAKDSIQCYFSFIRDAADVDSIFYCCNRVEKGMSLNDGGKKFVNRFHEYPWADSDNVLEFKLARIYRNFTYEPFFYKVVNISK